MAQSVRVTDLVRRAILAGTGPAGAGGLDEVTKVAVAAYVKAALGTRNLTRASPSQAHCLSATRSENTCRLYW